MKKTFTNLLLGCATLLLAVSMPGKATAQNTSSGEQNGVKVSVLTTLANRTTRIDFLNTNHEDVVFTWSIKDKNGKIVYTSGFVEIKAGSAYSYPGSKEDSVTMLNGEINANEIEISLKK